MDIELEKWLKDTFSQREELIAYGCSFLPRDMGERMSDMEKAIQKSADAENLLADAELFLSHARRQSMFKAMLDNKLTAKQIDIIIKDDTRVLQRIVDGLQITARSIKSRLMSDLNANRAR